MLPPARILAAVDFSETSAHALAYAARLSRLCGVELMLLHVVDPGLAAAAAETSIDLLAKAREELESFSAAVPWMPADARYLVVTGFPGDAIMHIAARENADLTVVGAGGVSMPDRIAAGHTSEKVLRMSDRPVLIVPDATPRAGPRKGLAIGPILVGLACTEGAADAARAARQLAARLGAPLRFIHGVAPITTAHRWSALSTIAVRRRRDAERHEMKVLLQGLSLDPAALDVRIGPVVQLLVEATADEHDALVVLGRAGGGPGHVCGASIARRLLTLASLPVLVHVGHA